LGVGNGGLHMDSSEIVPYIGCASGFLGHLGCDCGLKISHGGCVVNFGEINPCIRALQMVIMVILVLIIN
jgi:hypothetical protein